MPRPPQDDSESEGTLILNGKHDPPLRANQPNEDDVEDGNDEEGSQPASPATPVDGDDESSTSEIAIFSTPERPPDVPEDVPWREALFTTPPYGNSGPNRHELHEMCTALMQFFGDNHPDIMMNLGVCLGI